MKNNKRFITLVALSLLLASLIWGCAFVAQSVGMEQVGALTFHCVRFFLAALAMLNAAPDALARDMMDVDAFLAQQKGYGFWGADKKTRLMHAAMIVSDEYVPRDAVDTAALTGTVSLIIAQQMAMYAIMASTAAANAAATSNS